MAVYVASAAALTLSPGREHSLQVLRRLQYAAIESGLSWEAAGHIEFVANVVLLVPVPLLGAVALDRYGFVLWVLVAGVGASCVVEFAQLVFMPGRTASLADVAANSLGALIGWSCGRVARRQRRSDRGEQRAASSASAEVEHPVPEVRATSAPRAHSGGAGCD